MSPFSASQNADQTDLSLSHFQFHLKKTDLVLRIEITRWQAAGQDSADHFRGLYLSDEQINQILKRPLGFSWGETTKLDAETQTSITKQQKQLDQSIKNIEEKCKKAGTKPRLNFLADLFGLSELEKQILLICAAPAIDLKYEKLFGYLQDDVTQKRPSINLLLDLFAAAGVERFGLWNLFTENAPLIKNRLLHKKNNESSHLVQTLEIDSNVLAWLIGQYDSKSNENQRTTLLSENSTNDFILLSPEQITWTDQINIENTPVINHYGVDQLSMEIAARKLAKNNQMRFLNAEILKIEEDTLPELYIQQFIRDGKINHALVFIQGWEKLIVDKQYIPVKVLEILNEANWPIVTCSTEKWHPGGESRLVNYAWKEFSIPTYKQRKTIWDYYLNHELDMTDIEGVAGQFSLNTQQICDASQIARDSALQEGTPLKEAHLLSAARSHTNPNLMKLAKKITPRYHWEDIILPEDQIMILKEMVATVKTRPFVLEEWGLGKKLTSSSGVATLFAGPPGTGKTMAAEILARELGLDVYKIDLSSVVSKYIGETEKNIAKIFQEAETSNAILFFDEADALFGKRSEVKDSHDRYANIEISYLLQRMEAYNGITILATNLRANLDEAFTRRLQFVVDFPFPEEEYRIRIWETLFPEQVPREKEIDLVSLAKKHRLAGGNIRNILVYATFLAASDGNMIRMEHLRHGVYRELQKLGRLVDKDEIELTGE